MPRYAYQCECGVQFEASAPAAKHADPKPCPDCKASAPRLMPTDMSGVFNQTVTGPAPQNTGIHSLDAHIDRVIGQSAKQGWEQEDARRREKRRLLVQTGAKSEDISMNPDGTYRVRQRTEAEKAHHERALAIDFEAQRALKSKKPKPAR